MSRFIALDVKFLKNVLINNNHLNITLSAITTELACKAIHCMPSDNFISIYYTKGVLFLHRK